jgi:ribonucleoside-triphosphate reductase (thioredoxin)
MSKGQLPENLRNFTPKFGPIGETVFKRSYSQNIGDRKEEWPETGVRVVDGNLSLVDSKFIEPDEREKLLNLLLPFDILPAGRHLSCSGRAGRQFLFNCHASGWDPNEPQAHFTFLFDELMQGGGVGANYSDRYLETMPSIRRSLDLHLVCNQNHPDHHEFSNLLSSHVHEENVKEDVAYLNVEDSREGWVDAVNFLMDMAFDLGNRHSGYKEPIPVVVDVSGIRKRGSPLKTSGGIACGPGPLVSMLSDLVKQLNSCVGRKLDWEDAMILDHIQASCVIAGGKRRSSRMSVKYWRDPGIFKFINVKREDGSHWTTNISVEIDSDFLNCYASEDPWACKVMKAVVLGKRLNGEPGFWNRSLASKGEREPELMYCPNPCGEIGLQMWENCNLGHVNLEHFAKRPMAQVMEAFRLMSRFLVRATFGDIPQPRQRAVVDRNRRIGVGFTGFHGFIALRWGLKYSECHEAESVKTFLKRAFEMVKTEGTSYATAQGIPVPVAFTALAPTGSISALPGVTTSCQALDFAWFLRLVRYSDMDPELAVKRSEGYEVFTDEDAANTAIVKYWCEHPLVSKVKASGLDPSILETQFQVPFMDSLKVQAMIQDLYADNAISYTVNLPEDVQGLSEDEMEAQLAEILPRLKGTTMYVAKSRKNTPIQPITKEQFDAHQGPKQITMVEDDCKNGCPAV